MPAGMTTSIHVPPQRGVGDGTEVPLSVPEKGEGEHGGEGDTGALFRLVGEGVTKLTVLCCDRQVCVL